MRSDVIFYYTADQRFGKLVAFQGYDISRPKQFYFTVPLHARVLLYFRTEDTEVGACEQSVIEKPKESVGTSSTGRVTPLIIWLAP